MGDITSGMAVSFSVNMLLTQNCPTGKSNFKKGMYQSQQRIASKRIVIAVGSCTWMSALLLLSSAGRAWKSVHDMVSCQGA